MDVQLDREGSPSQSQLPTTALNAPCLEPITRCLSTSSSISHGSATTHESSGAYSEYTLSSASSRQSSASYASPRVSDVSSSSLDESSAASSTPSVSSTARSKSHTMGSGALREHVRRSDTAAPKRRGYSRPMGTDFAASARSRDSVLSLGSISHLQYYFARTGLLDGKGGQMAARQRLRKGLTLDMSNFLGSFDGASLPLVVDGSLEQAAAARRVSSGAFLGCELSSSPVEERFEGEDGVFGEEGEGEEGEDEEEFEVSDPNILPPTTSTYHARQKLIPKPPTMQELKAELDLALEQAAQAVQQVEAAQSVTESAPESASETPHPDASSGIPAPDSPISSWHEIQGLHIIDLLTLAIRAAKIYYLSHDHPTRLETIAPERQVRSAILTVMDTLRRLAQRRFAGGIYTDELAVMSNWIVGVQTMLRSEEAMLSEMAREQAGWTWARDEDWLGKGEGSVYAREHAFLQTLLKDAQIDEAILPTWEPINRSNPPSATPPFLLALQSGILLINLHNAALARTTKRFGAITTYHTDTCKPYRAAENLRFWAKAAELRWEIPAAVMARVDSLGIACASGSREGSSNSREVWIGLEDVLLVWCKRVREEIVDGGI